MRIWGQFAGRGTKERDVAHEVAAGGAKWARCPGKRPLGRGVRGRCMAEGYLHSQFFFLILFFGRSTAYRALGPGIRSELQLWPMLQLWQLGILNPLCQAGDWTCLLERQRHHPSRCTKWELPSILSFKLCKSSAKVGPTCTTASVSGVLRRWRERDFITC